MKDLQELSFSSQAAFETWLATHHTDSPGIWLKFAKKASGIPTISYAEAVEVALCYGWIDGQLKPVDATWYKQRFVPRRPKSLWSQINIARAEKLIKEGRMRPAGQAAIDAAQADGRWAAAYDSPSAMQMPDDFKAELAKRPKAQSYYETLNKTNTYAVLWRIQTAKKPETRKARIDKLIAMLERGEKLH